MFHGGGGTAKDAIKETGWTDQAEQAGFLAVFPEGTPPDLTKPANFRKNPQTWNDGSGRFQPSVDEAAFARALLDDLAARFNVDPLRIYFTGFSNGSSLSYRLGVELSDRVAAIAPVGSSGLRLADPQKLVFPVSLIAIQGLADRLNPIEGGDVKSFGRSEADTRSPIKVTIERWAIMLECPSAPTVISDQDGVTITRYGPDKAGSEIIYYVIDDMGHAWPGGNGQLPRWLVGKTTKKIKATDVIWAFFEKHPKPEAK